jgi:hypothetical protein
VAIASTWIGSSGTARGMRLSITLTTPPIADDPNSSAAGPRSTSIRSAVSGLMTTAWSTEVFETSKLPIPSVRMRTRSPWKPRSTGRDAFGPNAVEETPACRFSVSPSVGLSSRVSAAPLSTEVPDNMSDWLRSNGAVTTISRGAWP